MSAPTVRRRRLGAELRRLREAAGLKMGDVTERTGIPASKVSRIESAQVNVKAADLSTLLDCYGVDGASDAGKREALHALAKQGGRRGWWQPYRDIISTDYADLISLEAEAKSMRSFETLLIPGLLQTAAYARATIAAINMTDPPERVNALAEVRVARQSVLTTREDPLEFWAIIHESALRSGIGSSPQVMRDQLQRLLDLQELPNVSIQALAWDTAPHPGMAGPFAVLSFPESADLDVVLVENLTSALYVEDAAEVSRYGSAFERLRAAALPFDKTADLIAQLKDSTT
ncbi:helix-turn-helix domain protein [Actinobacteria bacterium OK074]|nr:helix-turn-helix domain protein [Actinobacteria bacterium OK074]